MKVLFFNYEYPPLGGGAANATKQILKEYAKRGGVEVALITASIDRGSHVETLSEGIQVHMLSIGKDPEKLSHQSHKDLLVYSWKAFWYARKLMQGSSYDVLHAFFTVPCGFIAMLLACLYNKPFIVSLRGSDVPGYSERFKGVYWILKPIIVYIWKRASRVISNSEGLRDLAYKSAPKQRIDIIYNGIDTEKFTPRNTNEGREIFTILFASRLMQRKGVKFIIEAFSLLHKKYSYLRLLIAGGDGDASKELHVQVDSLGLGEYIEFSGHYYHDDLPDIQRRGDVFVYPSFNEGMSNNVLEAMAGGLPIIMTPTGGSKELIVIGENGYIVDYSDSQAIAEKIEILLNDEALCRNMGDESRKKALGMSWKNVADQYREIYKQVSMK